MNNITVSGSIFKDSTVQQVGENSVVKFTILNKDRKKKNKETGKNEGEALFMNCEYWTKNPQQQLQQIVKGAWVSVIGQLQQNKGTDGVTYFSCKIPWFNYPEMQLNPFEHNVSVTTNNAPPATNNAPPAPQGNQPPAQAPIQNAGQVQQGQYQQQVQSTFQAPQNNQQQANRATAQQAQRNVTPQDQQFNNDNVPF